MMECAGSGRGAVLAGVFDICMHGLFMVHRLHTTLPTKLHTSGIHCVCFHACIFQFHASRILVDRIFMLWHCMFYICVCPIDLCAIATGTIQAFGTPNHGNVKRNDCRFRIDDGMIQELEQQLHLCDSILILRDIA